MFRRRRVLPPVRRAVVRRRWGCLPGCVIPLAGAALILLIIAVVLV
ncbi:MAG: hypothetical protein JXM73_10650 [Anaerolineae bacterium]|nr:hypothetical protein [Anaerolineae bacterium]